MKKKQLHIVNKYFHPVVAGIETALLETYSRFNPEEWDITVHASRDTLTDEDVLPESDTIDRVKVVRYHTSFDIFIPKVPWDEADVVLLNNFSLAPILPVLIYAYLIGAFGRRRAAVVLAPHGGFTPNWTGFSPLPRLIKQTAHRLGKFLVNHGVSAVQAVSEWEREQMIKAGIRPKLITVIANGVEDVAFDEEAEVSPEVRDLVASSKPYIAMISRLHPIKNLETAIHSLKYVDSPYKLIIMGKLEVQSYYEKLKKLAKNLNIENRVVFADQVSGASKYYVVRHAATFLHTSRFEVDPISVKEAMSQGAICICADVAGTSRVIRDGINGFLVPVNNHEKTAEKIMYVLEHANSRKLIAMKKRNKAEYAQHTWKHVAESVEQLFVSVAPRWSLSYSS